MTKNSVRRDRFKRIGEALTSIYNEANWRDRKGQHEFEMRPEVVKDSEVTTRAAGGPALKTIQYDAGTHGIRGLSHIADCLIALEKVERENLAKSIT